MTAADPAREAAACLDAFTACFNARDLAGMDRQLHFPHVILAGTRTIVWEAPGQLPADFFDQLAATGWARSVYEERTPLHLAPDKVHFRVRYTRRGADDKALSTHDNVWVVTRVDGRWGIAARSY